MCSSDLEVSPELVVSMGISLQFSNFCCFCSNFQSHTSSSSLSTRAVLCVSLLSSENHARSRWPLTELSRMATALRQLITPDGLFTLFGKLCSHSLSNFMFNLSWKYAVIESGSQKYTLRVHRFRGLFFLYVWGASTLIYFLFFH